MTSAATKRTVSDDDYGYPFGVDGLMSRDEACQFLGGICINTLEKLAVTGKVRKGKVPGGRKVFYCRRSVRDFAHRTEV